MSRRDNMKRIFVGNLPPDVRTRDLESLFYKFGKISFIDLKTRRGSPFAFVEFDDYRDAEEAVRCRDGKEWDGCRLRVEFPRGRERTSRFKNGSSSGGGRSGAPQRRSKFRVKVIGLPSTGSWQDLKDHMREVGEVCYADVYKGGEGVVEFVNYDDMRYAIRKLNNTKFKSHEGETSYIKLREDMPSGDSRSRSRSPVATRRGRKSPSYSPVNKRRGDSHSPSRSISRSPKPRRGTHHKRSSRRAGRSGSRSRSISRSPSHSRSPSGPPRSARGSSPGSPRRSARETSPGSPRRSPAGSSPGSPRRVPRGSSPGSPRRSAGGSSPGSPRRSPAGSSPASRGRSRSRSKSHSRSPPYDKSPANKSISRSPSPVANK